MGPAHWGFCAWGRKEVSKEDDLWDIEPRWTWVGRTWMATSFVALWQSTWCTRPSAWSRTTSWAWWWTPSTLWRSSTTRCWRRRERWMDYTQFWPQRRLSWKTKRNYEGSTSWISSSAEEDSRWIVARFWRRGCDLHSSVTSTRPRTTRSQWSLCGFGLPTIGRPYASG